jgi:endonuclease/exonuclease/phosphatase family metal-dependent hydrolase
MKRAKNSAVLNLLLALLVLAIGAVAQVGGGSVAFAQPAAQASVAAASPEAITVATFNIQIFGEAKAEKPKVMEVLAQTVSQYDIVAIQEVKGKTGTPMKKLEAAVDAKGRPCAVLISPRLGRKEPREQYAFLYRTDTLEPVGQPSLYREPAGSDQFSREPFLARFKSKRGKFTFVLINVHTEPETATKEILALKDVLAFARQQYPMEKDFIILGDLNADCKYYNPKQPNPIPGTTWLVPESADTTVKSTDCTYDRIIITDACQEDFAGEVQVFRFDQKFGLSYQDAIEVSDHFPVWARFNTDRDTD